MMTFDYEPSGYDTFRAMQLQQTARTAFEKFEDSFWGKLDQMLDDPEQKDDALEMVGQMLREDAERRQL